MSLHYYYDRNMRVEYFFSYSKPVVYYLYNVLVQTDWMKIQMVAYGTS